MLSSTLPLEHTLVVSSPTHQFLSQVFKNVARIGFRKQITQLLSRINLQQFDPSPHNLFSKPNGLRDIVFASRKKLRWKILSQD